VNTRSLRFRLVAWYGGLLTLVFVLLTAVMFFDLTHFLENNLRQSQLRRARQIADAVVSISQRNGEQSVAAEIKDRYDPELNDRFIRITRRDGSVLYLSGEPKDQSFDPRELPAVASAGRREFSQKLRLASGRHLLIAAVSCQGPDRTQYVVETGVPLEPIETMLNHLLLQLALGLPLALAVAIGGGYWLVQRALRPVDGIAQKAERITQHNLNERLPVAQSGDELERLSISLNHLISRLGDALYNSKRFVADASHELRTPLTVLRGELENLIQDGRLNQERRETLGSMLEEVERLTKIVEGLLALSRLDAGEAQVEWVEFNMAELAATTADQMSLLAEDKGIAIQCDAGQPVIVEGDRARLKQVVVNLLDNAIKYTQAGGVVRLAVARQNGHAILDVADNGIGIPPEALGHVFDRFFRVDKARSRDQGGAGLGLSIVKSICTAHGAQVEVESRPGKGTQFRIKLALSARAVTKPDNKNEN